MKVSHHRKDIAGCLSHRKYMLLLNRPTPGLSVDVDDDEPGCVHIRISACLDEELGCELLEAAGAAVFGGESRICIDLRGVTRFTDEGVAAAAQCCRVAAGLPRGVSFLVTSGISRKALLAIFALS